MIRPELGSVLEPGAIVQGCRGRRAGRALAFTVAIVATALLASGCATTGGDPQPPQSTLLPCDRETCVRVVTWNVHGLPFYSNTSDRMGRVAAKLLEQQPDVVFLQEVWLGHF